MCQPINCKSCGMTTWSGCGEHVAQVKAMVPDNQWCNGHATGPTTESAAPAHGGFFGTLIGR